MKITGLIKQPEGRRLEFKEKLPSATDIARTVIAFTNDAGGELFIGIKNEPRNIVGLPEQDLFAIEERICNIINDHCTPIIVPEISFHSVNDLNIIRVIIHRGSNLPYFLKSKGKKEGTVIRIGSTNRIADDEIIKELERQKQNISYDSEPVFSKAFSDLNIESFRSFFGEKTGEKLTTKTIQKLNLLKEHQGRLLPTNALVLLSDGQVKGEFFPYARIECARFKGTSSREFIDQKSVEGCIAMQVEAAYDFVLRHINKGAAVKGVYTESRWEYPVTAIREVIRNAVVHRDYSLSGKDIKLAVYDDMVEVTSPGLLLPSIDFNDLESGQSDIRNRTLAPVFKKLGIIDQWGNGLKLIAEDLHDYPEIEFRWKEVGLQLQVQFVKKEYKQRQKSDESERQADTELVPIWHQVGTKLGLSWDQAGTKLGPGWDQVIKLLKYCSKQRTLIEIMVDAGWKHKSKFRAKYITPLIGERLLSMTDPKNPTNPKQKYYLTDHGSGILEELMKLFQSF